MSRLAKNLSANFLSNAWSTALALLLTPLYVSWLGIESYGLIGFYASWVAVLGILDTGISVTAMRQLSWMSSREDERDAMPSLVRSIEIVYWAALGLIGSLMLALAWAFGAAVFASTSLAPGVVRDTLMLMAISLTVQVPSGLYTGGLLGLQRQVESSALVAGFGTLRAAGAIAVLTLVAPDIRLFFCWQIVASILQTGVTRQALQRAVAGGTPATFSPPLLLAVRRFAGGMTLVTGLSVILAQADKILLPRLVALDAFGVYMLAWTAASGLSRIATPLIQAFAPRFTELVARGEAVALAADVRRASRLLSAVLLPPAALLVVMPAPLLFAWLGDAALASDAAPLLAVLTGGTVLSASSYPALSVLYSQGRLRPVIVVTIASVFVVLPLLAFAAMRAGALGAAYCWLAYGLVMYLAYQVLALRALPGTSVAAAIVRDFLYPAALAFGVAAATSQMGDTTARGQILAVVCAGGLAGCALTLVCCTDLMNERSARGWRRTNSL